MYKVGNFFAMCGKGVVTALRYLQRKQILIPLIMLFALLVLNLIVNTKFFSISSVTDINGNRVLEGAIINLLNNASEVAILAIGMTFITAACGGQDISIGATMTIAASVIFALISTGSLFLAFLICCVVSIAFALFNGVLVSYFKLLPMVATLILFTSGRYIASWIGNEQTMVLPNSTKYFGNFFPGMPIPTPILITIVCVAIIFLVLKFSNLRLYTESVGINAKSAKLNGIRPERIKMIAFIIMGLCVAVAGFIKISRTGKGGYQSLASGIELDVILAVAIGGTMLGGGKFNLVGSIIGAYIIQLLTNTLYSIKVSPESLNVYKAVFVIALVILGSPVVREKFSTFFVKLKNSVKKRSKGNRDSNNIEIEKEGL